MPHQFEQRQNFLRVPVKKEFFEPTVPKLSYEIYFKIFGVLSNDLKLGPQIESLRSNNNCFKLSRLYCITICVFLWLSTARVFILLFIEDKETQVRMGDITYFWNNYRLYYLIPNFFCGLHAALINTHFISKENDNAWLVPFVSATHHSADHQRTLNPFYTYQTRTRLFILFNVSLICFTISFNFYTYYITYRDRLDDTTTQMYIPWMIFHLVWLFYNIGSVLFTTSYFNLVCKEVEKRFAIVSKEIEDLAESDPGQPGSKNEILMSLYFAHNELCELVDESNSYWQSYLFYTAISYIPCGCYLLYVLFFATMDNILLTYCVFTFIYSLIILIIIASSAADVSSEVQFLIFIF